MSFFLLKKDGSCNVRNIVIFGLILTFLYSLFVAYCYFILGNLEIAEENFFMENTQFFLLLLSSILFFVAALRLKREMRLLGFFLMVLMMVLLHREAELDYGQVPNWIAFIFESRHRVWLILPGLVLLLCLCFRLPYFWRNASFFVRCYSSWLLLAAIVFYVVFSTLFERYLDNFTAHVFFEELSECWATFFFFLVSCVMVLEYRHAPLRKVK